MKAVFLILVVLCLLVLGAHFLRYGNAVGVAFSLAPITLLFVQKPWAARVVQAVLILGAIEWALTFYELVQMRLALGMPAMRMAVILAAVIFVTAASGLLFETRTMKQVFKRQ